MMTVIKDYSELSGTNLKNKFMIKTGMSTRMDIKYLHLNVTFYRVSLPGFLKILEIPTVFNMKKI